MQDGVHPPFSIAMEETALPGERNEDPISGLGPLWRWTPARPAKSERIGHLASRWYDVAGFRLHARVGVEAVAPGASAVVLLHGLAVSSAYMVPTAVRLAVDYSVYAPDLPGFGLSDKPAQALDIPQLADALVGWMDAAGVQRAVLIGNSMGCQIIVDAAVRYPNRVVAAVLQGPTIDRFARTLPRQLWRVSLDVMREHPTQPVVQARDYLRFGIRRALDTFRSSVEDRIEDKLPLVQTPVLLVRGERDPIVSQPWVEELARLAPNGNLVVMPGAAHTPNYSAPTEFVRVVRPFLDAGSDR